MSRLVAIVGDGQMGLVLADALVEQGGTTAGQTVLVLGTGGVALFALLLARALGARVIVTSSSDAKLERARELGATDTVNYRTTPEWDRRVKELTDGAGQVSAVGPGVTRVKEGDRVAGVFNQAWISGPPRREHVRSSLGGPLDGLLEEQVVLEADGVVRLPEHLSFEEAACLPCAGVTAWNALVEQGRLAAGPTLSLIHL